MEENLLASLDFYRTKCNLEQLNMLNSYVKRVHGTFNMHGNFGP
jgi:hypothetical protein